MIIGNPHEFAVWYELLDSDANGWYFGPFNFFIKGELLERDAKLSNSTLNCMFDCLKETFKNDEPVTKVSGEYNGKNLFIRAMHSHGYQTYDDIKIPSEWFSSDNPKIEKVVDLIIELHEDRQSIPKFGVELQCYPPDMTDVGWYFFLFEDIQRNKELLLFSKDYGKTVSEAFFEIDLIKSIILQLPCPDNQRSSD